MDNLFPAELKARLDEIGAAELVVGIPSYNNARTIPHVVRAVVAGLAKYFPERRAILVNSDGGSKDGTQQAVLEAQVDTEALLQVAYPVQPLQRISTPYDGLPGKGSAFRTIFAIAKRLSAKACIVVDSDLRSINPDWVELLARPILDRDFDYVAPFYLRHKYDGTITNGIIYPLTRTLFGKRIRQPIGGDFGFSGRLAARYLEKDVWNSDVARFGVDIWMTVTAIAEGFRVSQAYLGAKLHDAKDPGADLTSMFLQVVGSLFSLLETYQSVWQHTDGSEAVPMFGFPFDVSVEPIAVNVERMMKGFVQAVTDLRDIYQTFLSHGTLAGLADCAAPRDDFHFPDRLWVHLIYEFAASWHARKLDREHLLQSLVPLYLGRTASFVLETRESSAREVEQRIEQLCEVFEGEKPYLEELWNQLSKKEMSHAASD
ncbi:MAG TPA: glycosyltransferase [Candidatus Acidoferrales bacterium]